jgi:hypothetical protein
VLHLAASFETSWSGWRRGSRCATARPPRTTVARRSSTNWHRGRSRRAIPAGLIEIRNRDMLVSTTTTVRKLVEIRCAEHCRLTSRTAAAISPRGDPARLRAARRPVEVCRALAADPRTQIPILVVTAKPERMRSDFQPFPAVDFITSSQHPI